MVKAVLYSRVSTEEQAREGRSIEDQLTRLREEARQRGYKVVATFKDEGYSGTTDNRPGLQEMLAFCQQYPVDLVFVVDTDRLAREEHLHFALKALLKRAGVQVVSLHQPMIDDSPEGVFLDTILAAVNALQPKITARKTRLSLEEKARSGWYPGPAPTGYLNRDNPHASGPLDRRIILPDPERASPLSRAFLLFATGGIQ